MFEIFAFLPPDELAAPHILEWQHEYYKVVENASSRVVQFQDDETPEFRQEYWDLLYELAVAGLNPYVKTLLSFHSHGR